MRCFFRTAFHYITNKQNNQEKNRLIFGKELWCKNNVKLDKTWRFFVVKKSLKNPIVTYG